MQNQAHTESTMRSASAAGRMANAQALHPAAAGSYRGIELARDLLSRLFRHLPLKLTLRLWDDSTLQVGAGDAGAEQSRFELVFRNPEVVYSAVLGRDP